MWRRAWISLIALPLFGISSAAPGLREAPNLSAVPANQLVVAGNACGPAALLNAFRFGNENWRRVSDAVAGNNDRERILAIIREIGMRPSKHIPGHPRWSRRGVSVADLEDMANEMCAGKFLPLVGDEVFFLKPGESPEKLLARAHQRLGTSLAKGLPPVLSIRRYARKNTTGNAPWAVIDAHFVTITSVPLRLEKNARSFPVSYIDPWGGKRCPGNIAIPAQPVLADAAGRSSCLEAAFPQASVGKQLVRGGRKSVLTVSAAIGRW